MWNGFIPVLEGDQVYLLVGSRDLAVLHPHEDGYKVMGNARIQGLMMGQLFGRRSWNLSGRCRYTPPAFDESRTVEVFIYLLAVPITTRTPRYPKTNIAQQQVAEPIIYQYSHKN
jgi:hypothetical protein